MRICTWVRHHGAAYAGGLLGPRAHRRIEFHLASCPECARACRAEKRMDELLAAELGALARMQDAGLSWEQIRPLVARGTSRASEANRLGELIRGWWRESLLPRVAWRFAVLRYWLARATVPAVSMALAIIASILFTKGGEGVAPFQTNPTSSPMMVIKIAFRPEGVPAPTGYCESAGETYGTRRSPCGTITYGWRQ